MLSNSDAFSSSVAASVALPWEPVPLTVPRPFHGEALLVFFGRHAVPGVESFREHVDGDGRHSLHYARTLRLRGGPAVVELSWASNTLTAAAQLSDGRDLASVTQRVEHLCDLAQDLGPVEHHFCGDPVLLPLVTAAPGLRVPGSADPHEQLIRTMIGQQISLAGAAGCAGKLTARFGDPLPAALDGTGAAVEPALPNRLFPSAESLAAADPASLPMPAARGRAIVAVAERLASGDLPLDFDSDPTETRARLLAQPGIGPWTADYVVMRALHADDVLLASDLVIKRELTRRAISDTAAWAPWRSYATMHLWRAWTG